MLYWTARVSETVRKENGRGRIGRQKNIKQVAFILARAFWWHRYHENVWKLGMHTISGTRGGKFKFNQTVKRTTKTCNFTRELTETKPTLGKPLPPVDKSKAHLNNIFQDQTNYCKIICKEV